jgi:hypothetical protein
MEPAVVIPVQVSLPFLEAGRTCESSTATLIDSLSRAFGPTGLGVILISDIPGLLERRTRLLSSYQRLSVAFLADPVATNALLVKHGLGSDVRMKTMKPTKQAKSKAATGASDADTLLPGHTLSSTLLFKWSCIDGLSAIARGPEASSSVDTSAVAGEEDIDDLILSIQTDMQCLSATMTLVAHKVALACDTWLSTTVAPILLESGAAKARLIHYKSGKQTPASAFTRHISNPSASPVSNPVSNPSSSTLPLSDPTANPLSLAAYGNWQAWHYDYGLLTALIGPMLHAGDKELMSNAAVDATSCVMKSAEEGGEGGGEERRGEVTCGLVVLPPSHPSPSHDHIEDTATTPLPVIVNIPPDCIAIQIGEAAQILSGNRLIATPHAVIRPIPRMSPASSTPIPETSSRDTTAWLESISRQIFVVFLQPTWKTPLIASDSTPAAPPLERTCLSDILPPLHTRWSPGIDFSDFSKNTTGAYFGRGGMQR